MPSKRFNKLPKGTSNLQSEAIEKLLTNKKNSSSKNKIKTSSSIEKLILEKIK